MKQKLYSALLFAGVVAIGCQGDAPVSGQGTTGTPPTAATTSGVASAPAPVLPEELKSDAYHWFGLGYEKPMNLIVNTSRGEEYRGTQTTKLKSVQDGKAVFEMERTGELAEKLGSETLSLEKDGIYAVGNSQAIGDVRNLEIVGKLAPGVKWGNDYKLELRDGAVEQKAKFVVVGPTQVPTKAGIQSALLIKGSGEMLIKNLKFRMESSFWYVKDKGLVKNVVTLYSTADKKAKPQMITIQETK